MNMYKKDVIKIAKSIIDLLQNDAQNLINDYMSEDNKRFTRAYYHSDIGLFPKLVKKKIGFKIHWYKPVCIYRKQAGRWIITSKYIPIKNGYRYNLDDHAKKWEIAQANKFEDQAETIRKEVSLYLALITGLERL